MTNEYLFSTELEFILTMKESKNYIRMAKLKHNYSYQIFARNAYAGVWDEHKEGFLISRYKVGPKNYLFHEYHWDWDEQLGTVKPLKLIEKCPFLIDHIDSNRDRKKTEALDYLDALEEANPVIHGFNTVRHRRQAAIEFAARLSGDRHSGLSERRYVTHHRIILDF